MRSAATAAAAAFGILLLLQAEGPQPVYRVDVNMMVLNFTVKDNKGRYISGLKPENIRVREDGIPQSIVSFWEESSKEASISPGMNRSVFILFDTSNNMYAGLVYAQEAILRFIRQLHPTDHVAVYSFSRNLFRAQGLTPDHQKAIRAVRNIVAGDQTALFNCLLLTLRDAAKVPGHKAVVVFSNGADDASMLSPDDVRRVAEDEGIPIYVVSAGPYNPISKAVFKRLTENTGGRVYYAPRWEDQKEAFAAIREEFQNSYTLTYYPAPNPNEGFRHIEVEILGRGEEGYQVQARPGYRPHPASVPARHAAR